MPKKNLSVLKRARQSKKREERNQNIKSKTKTYLKKARVLLAEKKQEEAGQKVREAIRQLDKAASMGVIHKNTTSRKKSRLMKGLKNIIGTI